MSVNVPKLKSPGKLPTAIAGFDEITGGGLARGYAAKGPLPNLLPHMYLDALLVFQLVRVSVLHRRRART